MAGAATPRKPQCCLSLVGDSNALTAVFHLWPGLMPWNQHNPYILNPLLWDLSLVCGGFVLIFNDCYYSHYQSFPLFCQLFTAHQRDPVSLSLFLAHTHKFTTPKYYLSHITSIMFHHPWLDRVPWAKQQDPIPYPLQMQEFASLNPRLQVCPTPSPSPLTTPSLFSKCIHFFPLECFIGAIYSFPDWWYQMVFVASFLTYFT